MVPPRLVSRSSYRALWTNSSTRSAAACTGAVAEKITPIAAAVRAPAPLSLHMNCPLKKWPVRTMLGGATDRSRATRDQDITPALQYRALLGAELRRSGRHVSRGIKWRIAAVGVEQVFTRINFRGPRHQLFGLTHAIGRHDRVLFAGTHAIVRLAPHSNIAWRR
jgi:hypothetical protein